MKTVIMILCQILFLSNLAQADIQPPTLVSPENNAKNVFIPPTLVWAIVPEASGYDIQISDSADFAVLHFEKAALASTEIMADGLNFGLQYFWRVRSTNSVLSSEWSNIYVFSTAPPPPDVPDLAYPPNGTGGLGIFIGLQIKIMLYPDNRNFEVQVSTSNSFDSIIFSEAGSNAIFVPENLLPGSEYFWRARAKLPSTQYSSWSDTFSFQTGTFISIKHDQCSSATFSHDGKWLVTAGGDSAIKIWDVNNGTLIRSIIDNNPFSKVIFSPNGNTLATLGTYPCTTIKLWDFDTGDLIHTLDGNPEHVRSIDFSPDGDMLASTGNNVEYYLWDVKSGALLESHDLSNYSAWGLAVRFSPDGKKFVLSKVYGFIDLTDLETGGILTTFSGHKNDVDGIEFSPDGSKLITGAATYFDFSVRLWDVTNGTQIYILDQASSTSNNWLESVVGFSPDGHYAVSVGGIETDFSVRTSHVYVWDVASGTLVNTMNSQPTGLNFGPDGSLLAVTTRLGVELRVFGSPTIPIPPFLLKPEIGSRTSDNEFVWSPSGGGAYRLQVSSDPNFNDVVYESSNLTVSRATVEGLGSRQYFWRVMAKNSAGNSGWSGVGLFTYIFTAPAIYVNKGDATCGDNQPCYTSVQEAINVAITRTEIMIADGAYNEFITLNESKAVTLRGGWDTSFKAQSGNTILRHAPKATQGSLTLQMLSIKPE